MTTNSLPKIIAYDFDGTLTTKDTFVLFLRYYAGFWKWSLKMISLLPIFFAYKLGVIDRHFAKKHVVKAFFTAHDSTKIQQKADMFARTVIPTLIRPQGLTQFQADCQSSEHVYIVSASISPYLHAWAQAQGLDKARVIATDLALISDTIPPKTSGQIEGLNCWGEHKITKIQMAMRAQGFESFQISNAYGDSRGDKEMLDCAQFAHFKPFRIKQHA